MLPLLFYCYTRYQINTWNARVRGLCPIRTNLFFEYLLENLSFLDRQFAALLPLFFVRLVVIFLCFYFLLCVCLVFFNFAEGNFFLFSAFFRQRAGAPPLHPASFKKLDQTFTNTYQQLCQCIWGLCPERRRASLAAQPPFGGFWWAGACAHAHLGDALDRASPLPKQSAGLFWKSPLAEVGKLWGVSAVSTADQRLVF